jgi:FrmR/RcnR family transcriptional regulator, repressor of frmRAB operon
MLSGSMTHTIREKQKLLARVRRMRGQIEGIERALNGEADCEQIPASHRWSARGYDGSDG